MFIRKYYLSWDYIVWAEKQAYFRQIYGLGWKMV
jgi:hypothetical protein